MVKLICTHVGYSPLSTHFTPGREYSARFGPGLDEVWILQDDESTTEDGEFWLACRMPDEKIAMFLNRPYENNVLFEVKL
ncbi:hypothetical protein KpP1_072 [Klebsiella phage P1]|uniref:Uncharacterized protein n=1 Tax=Klebsiella phage P1 TaxID=2862735 RepID=A0AC61N9X1_9CAUD|nr:hypothetical protein KpP1_072 [Klebsiella phage P1]